MVRSGSGVEACTDTEVDLLSPPSIDAVIVTVPASLGVFHLRETVLVEPGLIGIKVGWMLVTPFLLKVIYVCSEATSPVLLIDTYVVATLSRFRNCGVSVDIYYCKRGLRSTI